MKRTAVAPSTRKQTRAPAGKCGRTNRPAIARLAKRSWTTTRVRWTSGAGEAGRAELEITGAGPPGGGHRAGSRVPGADVACPGGRGPGRHMDGSLGPAATV